MERVRLETADGSLVGYTMIPFFNPPADVLYWGVRVFRRHGESGVMIHYRECLAFAVVGEVTAQ